MNIISMHSSMNFNIDNKAIEKVDYIEKLFPVKAIGEIFLKLFISIIFSIIVVKTLYFVSLCLKKIWIKKNKKNNQKKILKNLYKDEINLLKRFIVEDTSTIYEEEKEVGISSLIRKGIIVQGISVSIGKNQYYLEEWVKEEIKKDDKILV